MATYNNLVCAVLITALVAFAPLAHAAVTCGTVAQSLTPCLGYLKSGASGPAPAVCCGGIKSLKAPAQSTPDRQTVCRCLKMAAQQIKGINIGLAVTIPGKCGVSVPYKLDPSIDCSKALLTDGCQELRGGWYAFQDPGEVKPDLTYLWCINGFSAMDIYK